MSGRPAAAYLQDAAEVLASTPKSSRSRTRASTTTRAVVVEEKSPGRDDGKFAQHLGALQIWRPVRA
jgi:hypothetical protein